MKTEDEKLHLMEKLNLAEDQVSALMLQKDNESSSRPVSFISVTSSNSETGECLLQGEQKGVYMLIMNQNLFRSMVLLVYSCCLFSGFLFF